MSAIGKIMEELYTVRRQVLSVRDDDVKFAVYYGRLAEREMAMDRDVITWAPVIDRGSRWPQQIMGAMLMADYGLPPYAIRIDVDGKPYSVFSIENANDLSRK
jgi:hypothetical protein